MSVDSAVLRLPARATPESDQPLFVYDTEEERRPRKAAPDAAGGTSPLDYAAFVLEQQARYCQP